MADDRLLVVVLHDVAGAPAQLVVDEGAGRLHQAEESALVAATHGCLPLRPRILSGRRVWLRRPPVSEFLAQFEDGGRHAWSDEGEAARAAHAWAHVQALQAVDADWPRGDVDAALILDARRERSAANDGLGVASDGLVAECASVAAAKWLCEQQEAATRLRMHSAAPPEPAVSEGRDDAEQDGAVSAPPCRRIAGRGPVAASALAAAARSRALARLAKHGAVRWSSVWAPKGRGGHDGAVPVDCVTLVVDGPLASPTHAALQRTIRGLSNGAGGDAAAAVCGACATATLVVPTATAVPAMIAAASRLAGEGDADMASVAAGAAAGGAGDEDEGLEERLRSAVSGLPRRALTAAWPVSRAALPGGSAAYLVSKAAARRVCRALSQPTLAAFVAAFRGTALHADSLCCDMMKRAAVFPPVDQLAHRPAMTPPDAPDTESTPSALDAALAADADDALGANDTLLHGAESADVTYLEVDPTPLADVADVGSFGTEEAPPADTEDAPPLTDTPPSHDDGRMHAREQGADGIDACQPGDVDDGHAAAELAPAADSADAEVPRSADSEVSEAPQTGTVDPAPAPSLQQTSKRAVKAVALANDDDWPSAVVVAVSRLGAGRRSRGRKGSKKESSRMG